MAQAATRKAVQGASGRKMAGAAKRRSASPEARRAAILAAALDEFPVRGYEGAGLAGVARGARVADVARRAGVAKGTIYLYFTDKQALFQDLVRSMVNPILGTLEQLPQ